MKKLYHRKTDKLRTFLQSLILQVLDQARLWVTEHCLGYKSVSENLAYCTVYFVLIIVLAHRQTHSPGRLAWSEGRQLPGTVLHLPDVQVEGELSQWLVSWWQHHKHCPGIIIIFLNCKISVNTFMLTWLVRTSCICRKVAKSGNLYFHVFFSVSKQLSI